MNMSFRFNPFILETNMNQFKVFNGSFPSCPSPPFQSESWCKTFILEISFIHIQMLVHLHVNEINFHIKGFALGLADRCERLSGNGLLICGGLLRQAFLLPPFLCLLPFVSHSLTLSLPPSLSLSLSLFPTVYLHFSGYAMQTRRTTILPKGSTNSSVHSTVLW